MGTAIYYLSRNGRRVARFTSRDSAEREKLSMSRISMQLGLNKDRWEIEVKADTEKAENKRGGDKPLKESEVETERGRMEVPKKSKSLKNHNLLWLKIEHQKKGGGPFVTPRPNTIYV